MVEQLTFVTGNVNKLREVQQILGDSVPIVAHSLDLPELQGTLESVSAEKCKAAALLIDGPVMTEDTALCFTALNDLPGPKWFMAGVGHDGLNRMLAGFEDHSATAVCTLALSLGRGTEPILFMGKTRGTIVPPRSSEFNSGFGWDAIFQPDGFPHTYAEMDAMTKNGISHRYRALQQLKEYLAAANHSG